MQRVFLPVWKGPIEGFTVNYLHKNYWRVKGIIELDELMQEAKFVFYKLKKRYGHVDNNKWFMALFKSAFLNYFNGLSNRRTDRFSKEVDMDDDVMQMFQSSNTEQNLGYLVCLIEQAPSEVRAVLSLLSSAPRELLEEVAKSWKDQGRRKNEGSFHLSRLLGYDSDIDLVALVTDYFSNN